MYKYFCKPNALVRTVLALSFLHNNILAFTLILKKDIIWLVRQSSKLGIGKVQICQQHAILFNRELNDLSCSVFSGM